MHVTKSVRRLHRDESFEKTLKAMIFPPVSPVPISLQRSPPNHLLQYSRQEVLLFIPSPTLVTSHLLQTIPPFTSNNATLANSLRAGNLHPCPKSRFCKGNHEPLCRGRTSRLLRHRSVPRPRTRLLLHRWRPGRKVRQDQYRAHRRAPTR